VIPITTIGDVSGTCPQKWIVSECQIRVNESRSSPLQLQGEHDFPRIRGRVHVNVRYVLQRDQSSFCCFDLTLIQVVGIQILRRFSPQPCSELFSNHLPIGISRVPIRNRAKPAKNIPPTHLCALINNREPNPVP
jgi:hypothetical protein